MYSGLSGTVYRPTGMSARRIYENIGSYFNVVRTIIFSKKYVRVLYMSFHSYMVVFWAPIPIWDRELLILEPVAWVIAFKLHGEGIRGSQALSIALQGWALDESFLYGASKHVEYVWAKISQFHRRLVSWAGAIEPPSHNKSMRTWVPISMW